MREKRVTSLHYTACPTNLKMLRKVSTFLARTRVRDIYHICLVFLEQNSVHLLNSMKNEDHTSATNSLICIQCL